MPLPSRQDRFLDRHLTLRARGVGVEATLGRLPPEEDRYATDRCAGHFVSLVKEVEQHRQRLDAGYETALQELGTLLANVALPGTVRTAFLDTVDEAARLGRRARVWVDDAGSVVSGWPWEYLWLDELLERGGPGFVVVHPYCTVVRTCAPPTEPPASLSPSAPGVGSAAVVVLLVHADPRTKKYAPLGAEVQVREVQTILRNKLGPATVTCQVLERGEGCGPVTRSTLRQALAEWEPHLLYVVGHGGFDPSRQEGFIVLQAADGQGHDEMRASELAALLAAHARTVLVLLDTCRSSSRGFGGGQSVADALTEQGRLVLGTQFEWPAAACFPFWREFFASLALPVAADEALFHARDWLYLQEERGAWGERRLGCWGSVTMHRPLTPLAPRQPAEPRAEPYAELEKLLGFVRERNGNEMVEQLFALPSALLLTLALAFDPRTPEARARLLEEDPLPIMLMGEERDACECSPLWYTYLLEAPAELSWVPRNGAGPWRVRLSTTDLRAIPEQVVDKPFVSLSPELRALLPFGVKVRWEVRPAVAESGKDEPLFRAVFILRSPEEASKASAQVAEASTLPEGFTRDLAIANAYLAAGLYDCLNRHLNQMAEASLEPAQTFLVCRARANLYGMVCRKSNISGLTMEREAAQAAVFARHWVRAAYKALGLAWPDAMSEPEA